MRTTSQEHKQAVEDVWVLTMLSQSPFLLKRVIEPTAGERLHLQGQLFWLVFHHRRVLLHRLTSHSRGFCICITLSKFGLHVIVRFSL
jgi:hypothetical protein